MTDRSINQFSIAFGFLCGAIFFERKKKREYFYKCKYLRERKETEKWLKDEFIKKGGKPKIEYPIYLVLGESSYIFEADMHNWLIMESQAIY